MVLGLLIGLGAIKIACDVAEEYGKSASPGLNNEDFDLQNMANGINPRDVYNIAARCGVRPRNGILPYFGYKNCLQYVEKYANDPSDIDKFIAAWKRASKEREKIQSYTIQRNNKDEYNSVVSLFKGYKMGNTTIILTYNHWTDLLPKEHQERVDDIYRNTYIGQRTIKPPIIRFDPHRYGKRTEVWQVKGNIQDHQHDRHTKHRWNRLYAACCRQRGYNPRL